MTAVLTTLCQQFWIRASLLALPWVLCLRVDAMIAPNEEPKWAVFVLVGLGLAISGTWLRFQECRSSENVTLKPRDPVWVRVLCLIFLAGIALGACYSVNPEAAMNRLAFWLAAGLVFASSSASAHGVAHYFRGLQWALAISACLLAAFFWRDYFLKFNNPGFNKFVLFSRIGHFNFTADVLVILIPLLAWTTLSPQSAWLPLLALPALLTTGFMLLTSGSLGGMGGLAVGAGIAGTLGILAIMLGQSRRLPSPRQARPYRKWLLTLAGLATIATLTGKPILDRMPATFKEQMFTRAVWWKAPKASDLANAKQLPPLAPFWLAIQPYLGARTAMWASTTGMIAEQPWIGYGTGSYLYEYPAFAKRYDVFGDFETLGSRIKTNPHNVLLQIAAEHGVPMAVLFAGLYIGLTAQIMRQAWREPCAFWLCAVWVLWAAGLDAQVNHVFFNPASLFMAALALGVFHGRLPVANYPATSWPCHFWRSPLSVPLAIGLALILASYPLRWVVSEHYADMARKLPYIDRSASTLDERSHWETALKWSPNNTRALFGLAATSLRMGDESTAIRELQRFLALSPHHAEGLALLASLQARAGAVDDAAINLERAIRLEPDLPKFRETLTEINRLRAQPR